MVEILQRYPSLACAVFKQAQINKSLVYFVLDKRSDNLGEKLLVVVFDVGVEFVTGFVVIDL